MKRYMWETPEAWGYANTFREAKQKMVDKAADHGRTHMLLQRKYRCRGNIVHEYQDVSNAYPDDIDGFITIQKVKKNE